MNGGSHGGPLDYKILSADRHSPDGKTSFFSSLQDAPVLRADFVPGELLALLAVRRRRWKCIPSADQEHGKESSSAASRRQGIRRPAGLPAAGHPLRLSSQLHVPVRRAAQRDKHPD